MIERKGLMFSKGKQGYSFREKESEICEVIIVIVKEFSKVELEMLKKRSEKEKWL